MCNSLHIDVAASKLTQGERETSFSEILALCWQRGITKQMWQAVAYAESSEEHNPFP